MKITDIYQTKNAVNQPVISLEIFPPNTAAGEQTIFDTVANLTKRPDFISVTYRSENGEKTRQIAQTIEKEDKIPVLHHLTAAGTSQAKLTEVLSALTDTGIENILALRGDAIQPDDAYPYAKDLITAIKQQGDFNTAAACYPEGHVTSPLDVENIDHLRQKFAAGADFFISQLFFDNDKFYRLNEAAKVARITAPIAAGVMPIMSAKNVERLIFFGASIPPRLIKIINRYKDNPDDLRKAGLDYAFAQIDDLIAHGVDGVHIYTMNRASVANQAMERYL